MLHTDAAVTEHRERLLAEQAAADRARQAAAHDQLADAKAVCIEGGASFPACQQELIGVYMGAGEHEGWFHFENAEGKHLYYSQKTGEWRLNAKFDPSSGACCASVDAADGLLPVGEREWQV